MDAIEKLRREILSDYATSVGLSAEPKYISGAPLRPLVPLDVGSRVFIIGAYPSARFEFRDGISGVPEPGGCVHLRGGRPQPPRLVSLSASRVADLSHSVIASTAMRFASTSVSPSVKQPGSSGTFTQ